MPNFSTILSTDNPAFVFSVTVDLFPVSKVKCFVFTAFYYRQLFTKRLSGVEWIKGYPYVWGLDQSLLNFYYKLFI
jgi:hypothetical protein